MFEYVMGTNHTEGADHTADPPPGGAVSSHVLQGAGDCPPSLVRLVADVDRVVGESLVGGVGSGAVLTDRVTVLARLHTAIDAELGRSLVAAEGADALPHSTITLLERSAWWSRPASSRVVTAARFAQRHPELGRRWRCGLVTSEVIAALARGLRQVTYDVECIIVAAAIPELTKLSVAGVKLLVARALDLLDAADRDTAEQSNYDRRAVWWTDHGGMTMISADLPGIDGAAVTAALTALADSLRVEGDGLTAAQRRADALITLVNAAAAHGDLPATASGLAVAATITIGAAEADRVATGASRQTVTDLATQVRDGVDPASLGATTAHTADTTLGDAAVRFALCAGTWTGALVDDRGRRNLPISQALAGTHLQPLAVGRSIRLATGYQRIALAVRDGGCLLCDRPPAECQTHHVTEWSQGGTTDVDQMVLLCWSHHRQVDLGRWLIVRNTDPSPGAPFWRVEPVPRSQWRSDRRAA